MERSKEDGVRWEEKKKKLNRRDRMEKWKGKAKKQKSS